jgi:hypothetical protein
MELLLVSLIMTLLPFMTGLKDCKWLLDMKVMGALLNPLYQSHYQMIEASLLTKNQQWAGKEELLDRITWYYATARDIANQVIEVTGGNKWDRSTYDFIDGIPVPQKQAEQEYDVYLSYMHSSLLPQMKKLVLGFNDNDGNLQDPIDAMGEVIIPGINLQSKMNHAQYIDKSRHYDIVSYLFDTRRYFQVFSILVLVKSVHMFLRKWIVRVCFSQAGFLADTCQSRTLVCFYECLIISKHRLHCIYCHLPYVKVLYVKSFRSNYWDEGDRDAKDFLKIEKYIFLCEFPMYANLFGGGSDAKKEDNNTNWCVDEIDKEEDEDNSMDDDDDDDDDDEDDGNKKPAALPV